MRILKTRWLVRFARRVGISDGSLREAIVRAEGGLIDADLGGGLIKQRVARTGKGRSGGYRMLVAYREGDKAIFVYGFAKSDRDSISPDELETWRKVAADWFNADDDRLAEAILDSSLTEIDGDEAA